MKSVFLSFIVLLVFSVYSSSLLAEKRLAYPASNCTVHTGVSSYSTDIKIDSFRIANLDTQKRAYITCPIANLSDQRPFDPRPWVRGFVRLVDGSTISNVSCRLYVTDGATHYSSSPAETTNSQTTFSFVAGLLRETNAVVLPPGFAAAMGCVLGVRQPPYSNTFVGIRNYGIIYQ